MKEIIFKNLTSKNKRIKNISATEILRKNNILIESNRETKYFINNPLRSIRNISIKKPEIHILKDIDTCKNTKKFNWKIKGKILIKFNAQIIPIDYEHTYELEIVNLAKNKKV